MNSSHDPGIVGAKTEPLQYGLKAIMYQVRHLGHCTQWRMRSLMTRLNQKMCSQIVTARSDPTFPYRSVRVELNVFGPAHRHPRSLLGSPQTPASFLSLN
jgi:hypothetical protein